MTESFIHYRPCVPYTTDEHSSLLDWVRDEYNTEDPTPERSNDQTIKLYWETEGRLFTNPGDAVYVADGRPSKVRRCYIVIDDSPATDSSPFDCFYPPNWLDRPATTP